MNKRPIAVIVKGNPERMLGKESLAKIYYSDIEKFLISEGFDVLFSESEPYTCPPVKNIAVWVGHSRGVGRLICIPKQKKIFFAKLGDIDGALNPNDLKWQKDIRKKYKDNISEMPSNEQPPKDHFEFSDIHKKEVMRVIENYNSKISMESFLPISAKW